MIFYVVPQSLQLRTHAQGGDGPPIYNSNPSPTPLAQFGSVDDSKRVTIDARTEACPRPEYEGGNAFRLRARPATVTEPHGAISKVEVLVRAYRSEAAGGDDWCRDGFTFPSYTPTNTLAAFLCPFVDINNTDTSNAGGLPASAYDWDHDNHSLIDGQFSYCGYRFNLNPRNVYFHDFSTGSSVPGASVKQMTWDCTHLHGAWTDSVIAGLRFGVASWEGDNGFVGGKYWSSGLPQGGSPSSSTPRWNVSQLVLKVTSADPPGQGNFIFLEE
jgi:hypothetical protein